MQMDIFVKRFIFYVIRKKSSNNLSKIHTPLSRNIKQNAPTHPHTPTGHPPQHLISANIDSTPECSGGRILIHSATNLLRYSGSRMPCVLVLAPSRTVQGMIYWVFVLTLLKLLYISVWDISGLLYFSVNS